MTAWRAPAGCEAGQCIEVADIAGRVGIRCPTAGRPGDVGIAVTRAEFAAFVKACRDGQYDDLTTPGGTL